MTPLRAALTAAAVITTAGCAPTPSVDRSEAKNVKRIAAWGAGLQEVMKICDHGRAVYVYDGVQNGGIDVVADAPECAEVQP